MDKILEWFTRKRILVISFLLSLSIYFFLYLSNKTDSFSLARSYESLIYFLTIFIPIFIFTIISLFNKDLTFNIWKKFTFVYLVVYLSLILFAPSRCEYIPFCEENIFIFFIPIYFLISLILILYKSFKK